MMIKIALTNPEKRTLGCCILDYVRNMTVIALSDDTAKQIEKKDIIMFADQQNEKTYDNEFNINFDNDALQLEAVEFVIDYIEEGMDHDDIEFESVSDILSTYDIGIKRDETFSTHQPEFDEPGSPSETILFEFNEQGRFLLNDYITAGYDRSALYAD